MLPGQKDKGSGVLRLPRKFPDKLKGFTIVELMVVSLITGIIMSALFMTLQVGELTYEIGSAKVDLESEVRTLVDWISRDLRQAKIQEMNNNTPATDHIKFSLWTWNNTTNTTNLKSSYIEYSYASANQTLSRNYRDEGSTIFTVNFKNITMAPFYTSYTNETSNSFSNATLLTSRKIIVAVKKTKVVKNKNLNFSMVEEVRVRNE
jgi:prepilin-type N-terminal cleavage/methylation domain-containing protein